MDTKFASSISRIAASIADAFVLLLVSYVVNFVIAYFYPFTGDVKNLLYFFVLDIVIYIILSIIYYPICWLKFDGATIGKKLAAIKIVKTEGTPLTLGTVIARMIGYLISGLVFGLGYLWILWDKQRQGWHDKLAKTYVVKTDAQPNTKLLWIFFIGFVLLSSMGNVFHKDTNNVTLINKDGSTINSEVPTNSEGNKSTTIKDAVNEVSNTVFAAKIYEGEDSIKAGNYWGHAFEFYEKANLNIELNIDQGVADVGIMTETEFSKFRNGDPFKLTHEVATSPDIVTLDAGKYVFVVIPFKEDIHYKVSLNATKVQ
jgi:uncharacterized RDD family membrane protein YckC